MNFYYNNNDLALKQMKQFADKYYSSSTLDGGELAQTGAKAIARSQLEIWALANRRARAALGLPSELAACKTPQDFMSVYCNFWQSAFTECAETTNRVSQLLAPRLEEPAEVMEVKQSPDAVKVIRSNSVRNGHNKVRSRHQEELRQAS